MGRGLFDPIRAQPAAWQVFEIEIFRGSPIREADLVASAVGDDFVFDDPDLPATRGGFNQKLVYQPWGLA